MSTSKKQLLFIKYFTLAYIAIFTAYSIFNGGYEFLFYAFVMLTAVQIITISYKRIQFGKSILLLLSLFGLLHLLSGQVYIDGIRLYDYWIIPGYIKFDNIVHTIGGAVSALVSYNFLKDHISDKLGYSFIAIVAITVTMASGFGAYNEIIELIAVKYLNAADKVGGYMNNAMDLVFNLIGAFIAGSIVGIYKGILKIDIE
jgi:uncharacterized membrane protein YjdF